MVKQFAGFTPEQLGRIDPSLQGMQSDEQQKIIAANPALAARVGKMSEMAQKRIGMAQGGYAKRGYALGGAINTVLGAAVTPAMRQGTNEQAEAMLNTEQFQTNLQNAQPGGFTKFVQPLGVMQQGNSFNNGQQAVQQNFNQAANQQRLADVEKRMQEYTGSDEFKQLQQAANSANDRVLKSTLQQFGLNDASQVASLPPEQRKAFSDTYNTTVNSSPEMAALQRGVAGARSGPKPMVMPTSLDPAQKSYADSLQKLQDARNAQAANPEDESLVTAVANAEAAANLAKEQLGTAEEQFKLTNMPTSAELISGALKDPTSMVTPTDVAATPVDSTQLMDPTTGQLTGPAPTAGLTTATTAAPVTAPTATAAPQVEAAQAAQQVGQALAGTQAAQGQVSQEAQMQAAQMSPQQLAQLGLQAAQGQAATVQGAPTRTLDQAELVSGSAVDQQRVDQAFGTGEVEAATVSGELASLMKDFDTGTPPWAAGAMRAANAQLAARGLSSSSMAGMAIVQAAMESALPIAQMDASNKQQVALMKAEQRAKFMGMEFDQNFQTKVMNAAKISEIANMNFTAQQQVALENSKMAQTMNLANLSNRQAKIMADAAAMSQMDLTNLNNRQQAQVQNAQAFLQMDMANLDNEQQTAMFKAQSMVNTILSDTAAENASRQFNASSQMQTDQFFANLTATVDMYNNEQINKMNMFNAGEANALERFNAEMINMRDQFNASNSLIVEQANTNWYKTIATADTAAINEANRLDAAAANNMTNLAFNSFMQEMRDIMSFAWQTENNDADRATQLAIAKISSDDAKAAASASKSAGFWGAIGSVTAAVLRRT